VSARVHLPWREWEELGWRRRRQVARHARRGRPHPDPHVAAVARAWAEQVRQPDRPSRRQRLRTAAVAGGIVALLVALAVTQDPLDLGSSVTFEAWRERRLARRILALPPS